MALAPSTTLAPADTLAPQADSYVPPVPPGTIGLVNQTAAALTAQAPAFTIPTTTAGNLLVAVVAVDSQTRWALEVRDSLGNVFRLAAPSRAFRTVDIWYLPNCAAGATSVTVTLTDSRQVAVNITEWQGVETAAPIEGTALWDSTLTTNTLFTSSGQRTTTDRCLLIAAAATHATGVTVDIDATSGFGALLSFDNIVLGRAAFRVADAGAYQAFWNIGESVQAGYTAGAVAAFREYGTPVGATVGTTAVGGATLELAADTKYSKKVTLSARQLVTVASWYLDGLGSSTTTEAAELRCALYDSNDNLLGVTDTVAFKKGHLPAVHEFTFAQSLDLAAGDYHVTLHCGLQTNVARLYYATLTNGMRTATDAFLDGAAATFGTATTASRDATAYVTHGPPPAADITAPVVTLTAPAAAAVVTGTAVTVSATATDNVGVAGVQFLLDGANLMTEDISAPFSITWNTVGVAPGSHVLTARARDAAGNTTTSSPVTVTVANAVTVVGSTGLTSNPGLGGNGYITRAGTVTPTPPPSQPTEPGMPVVTCEIAFASDPMAGSFSYTDVSADVRSITINRGRSNELDRFEVGTCSIRLANRHRNYDPSNTSSPHYPVRPMRRVRIRATYGNVTYSLFVGFVEGWPISRRGPLDSEVDITAIDGLGALAQVEIGGFYPEQRSGERINMILDDIGWPASERNVAAGRSYVAELDLQGSETNALAEMQNASASEFGTLFADRAGIVIFRDRYFRLTNVTAGVTLGDGGRGTGELPYTDLKPNFHTERIFNHAVVSLPDWEPGESENLTSQTRYFRHSLAIDTNLADPDDADSAAQFYVRRYAEPFVTIDSVSFEPRMDPALWAVALQFDPDHLVRILHRPPGGGPAIDVTHFTEGVTHEVHKLDWRTSLTMSPINPSSFWYLGTAALDSTAIPTW